MTDKELSNFLFLKFFAVNRLVESGLLNEEVNIEVSESVEK